MEYKKWLYCGIAILIGSMLIGILGTFWGIYSSFGAENEGIGTVGVGIFLIFTIVVVVGSAIGIALIVVGGVKAYRRTNVGITSATE